jgi:hypothetical protein
MLNLHVANIYFRYYLFNLYTFMKGSKSRQFTLYRTSTVQQRSRKNISSLFVYLYNRNIYIDRQRLTPRLHH